jgi:hypothetical protein
MQPSRFGLGQWRSVFIINIIIIINITIITHQEEAGGRGRKEPNENLRKPPTDYEFGLLENSGKLQVLLELLRSARDKSTDRFVVVSNYTTTLDYIGQVCKANGFTNNFRIFFFLIGHTEKRAEAFFFFSLFLQSTTHLFLYYLPLPPSCTP